LWIGWVDKATKEEGRERDGIKNARGGAGPLGLTVVSGNAQMNLTIKKTLVNVSNRSGGLFSRTSAIA